MISLLLTEQVGYVLYQIAWNDTHEAMEAAFLSRVHEDDLEAINYTDDQQAISWQEVNEDFYFRGELYDVAQTRTIDGKTWLYCIKERTENDLIEKYAKTTSLRKPNDIGISRPELLSEYVLKVKESSDKIISINTRFTNFEQHILLRAKEILIPPPRQTIQVV